MAFFHQTSRLFKEAFNKVDWPQVHRTLNKEVPWLFQVWECKQVMNIAATNKNLRQRHCNGWSNKCPCCTIHVETAEHILLCPKEGRIEALRLATTALERWLVEANTDPDLADNIVEYVQQGEQPQWRRSSKKLLAGSELWDSLRTGLGGDGF
jgi:hypothetical protein